MHSFWSDGIGFPEVGALWYKRHGYHFIAFTEHDRHQTGEHWRAVRDLQEREKSKNPDDSSIHLYQKLFGDGWIEYREDPQGLQVRLKPLYDYRHLLEEPEKFLILNGEEISVSSPGNSHWINVFNTPEPIPPQKSNVSAADAVERTLQAAAEASHSSRRPVLIFVDHPNFQWNLTAEELTAAPSLRFLEIHNALEDCHTYGDQLRAGAERIWDILLTLRLNQPDGSLVYGVANDDCHNGYHFSSDQGSYFAYPGRAWNMVRADRLTPERIMNAMLRGDFYASSGVSLRTVAAQPDRIQIEIEPEAGVHYKTQFIGTLRGVDCTPAPVFDASGKPVHTTQKYSQEIGKILAEDGSHNPSYQFSGDELYVRVLVASDRPHPRPTIPGAVKTAWTQPVVVKK
jgi:hypothetical protein